jgi:hypothetical protein
MERFDLRPSVFGPGPLARLGRARLHRMQAAGREVRECMRVLAKSGHNIVGELLRDSGGFYEWDHYPKGDVYDPVTHAQYYYHAHPAAERPAEHGHFHTFLRARGMPPGLAPAPLPDFTPPDDPNEVISHLVGISMDSFGQPVSLFTTNRWVTGEVWHAGRDVIRMLDRFEIDLARPSWAVNRWITAMLRLYRPQIEALIKARDASVAAAAADRPGGNVYEDTALEVTAEIAISVDEQIEAVDAGLRLAAGDG